ncbi:MAG: heavy-metal-associated domain-containing protein [Alphaproteobacteria bacterium]
MTCGGCTSKVTHALKAVSGVTDVKRYRSRTAKPQCNTTSD